MSRLIMKLAVSLLPPSRRAWGEAMIGEFAGLPSGHSGFALGCLGASLRENVTTGEGWARMGFFAISLIAISNIFTAVSHIGFWVDADIARWVRVNYVIDSIGAALASTLTLFLVYKTSSRTIGVEEAVDFGVKFVVIQVVGLISFAMFSVTNGIAQDMNIGSLAALSVLQLYAPSWVIFVSVAIYGWRGARQLHNAAFVAMVAIAILGLSGPEIYVRPADSVLAPFASLLGLESKMLPDRLSYLLDPPLSAIRMGMVWAVALILLLLKRWFVARTLGPT